jgi:hypothetical protein
MFIRVMAIPPSGDKGAYPMDLGSSLPKESPRAGAKSLRNRKVSPGFAIAEARRIVAPVVVGEG